MFELSILFANHVLTTWTKYEIYSIETSCYYPSKDKWKIILLVVKRLCVLKQVSLYYIALRSCLTYSPTKIHSHSVLLLFFSWDLMENCSKSKQMKLDFIVYNHEYSFIRMITNENILSTIIVHYQRWIRHNRIQFIISIPCEIIQ